MKKKFSIEQPGLKQNPYTVPEGYFNDLQNIVSEKISSEGGESRVWRVLKPQLALVSVFIFVFLLGYGVFKLIPLQDSGRDIYLNQKYTLMEEYQLKNSFIDFYDQKADSAATQKSEINPEEIIEYLDTDAGLLYLASLEI